MQVRTSIIVPFKNSEKWLDRCLGSLHKQEGNLQFIVVDDHSTDGGRKIAEEYAAKDSRLWVLVNEHAAGVSGARNTGLDHATGEWVTFLDADDYLTDDAADHFNQRINVNVIQFNHVRYFARTGRVRRKLRNAEGVYDIDNPPTGWPMVWNKLYRREFLEGIRFKEGLQYGEDELFNFECLAKDNRIYCKPDETIVHCFENRQSLTKTKTPEKLFAQIRALEEFLQEQDNPIVRCAVCRRLSFHWASRTYMEIMGHADRI